MSRTFPSRFRRGLRIAVATVVGSIVGSAIAQAADDRRPNVLFLAIDDLRVELGCYGSGHVHSPNIDGLASSGVRFDRAYCQVPVCGASRSSVLSGIRPTRTRFAQWYSQINRERPDTLTLPAHFKANGYHTVGRGKIFHSTADMIDSWSDPPWPKNASNVAKYLKPENRRRTPSPSTPFSRRGPPTEGRDLDVADDAYPDGELTDRVLADLAQLAKNDRPFFLAVGYWKPHLPFTAPKKYWDLYDPDKIDSVPNPFRPKHAPNAAVPVWNEYEMELRHHRGVPENGPIPDELARELRHGYYACISYVDAQVGRLLSELDRLGLADDTIVILWSDHGWQLGEHGLWGKKLLFEESLRVPLIVRAPGFPRNKSARGLVELLDLYPTLCDICGLQTPEHVVGSSLVPLLRDPKAPGREAAFSRMYDGDSVTTERHRLTEWTDLRSPSGSPMLYARTLFDLRDDPRENTNVAESPESTEIRDRHHALLRSARLKASEEGTAAERETVPFRKPRAAAEP